MPPFGSIGSRQSMPGVHDHVQDRPQVAVGVLDHQQAQLLEAAHHPAEAGIEELAEMPGDISGPLLDA